MTSDLKKRNAIEDIDLVKKKNKNNDFPEGEILVLKNCKRDCYIPYHTK